VKLSRLNTGRPQLMLSKEHINQALVDEWKNLEHEIKLKQAYKKQKKGLKLVRENEENRYANILSNRKAVEGV
jgi:hypothetical protein